MAFPTSDLTPSDAARQMITRAKQLRADAAGYIAQCDAGSLRLHDVAASFLAGELAPLKTEFATLAAVPGVAAELSRQVPALTDATAAQSAIDAVQTAIAAMITWLETNIPVDASRRVLSLILSNNGSGTLTQVTITGAGSLAAFRAQLVTFQSAFDA